MERRLAGWKARDLASHLEELAAAAGDWRAGKGERAAITVHLLSGQRHTGLVLELARGTLALQSLPQRGSTDLDVTVIPVARIEALTVHAAQAMVDVRPAADTATSPLDLKRRAKALADQLLSRIGTPIAIEIGSGELAQLAPLFEALREALERVCADDLGRGSLAERVQRIEVQGGAPTLSLVDGVLVVAGPLASDVLQRRLDAVL